MPRPAVPRYALVSDILQRHLSAALTGSADPREALASAARETRLALAAVRQPDRRGVPPPPPLGRRALPAVPPQHRGLHGVLGSPRAAARHGPRAPPRPLLPRARRGARDRAPAVGAADRRDGARVGMDLQRLLRRRERPPPARGTRARSDSVAERAGERDGRARDRGRLEDDAVRGPHRPRGPAGDPGRGPRGRAHRRPVGARSASGASSSRSSCRRFSWPRSSAPRRRTAPSTSSTS